MDSDEIIHTALLNVPLRAKRDNPFSCGNKLAHVVKRTLPASAPVV
jgi:hypothetical protein